MNLTVAIPHKTLHLSQGFQHTSLQICTTVYTQKLTKRKKESEKDKERDKGRKGGRKGEKIWSTKIETSWNIPFLVWNSIIM